MIITNESAIRAVVSGTVQAYASGFSDRHIAEADDEDGTINMKINNVFIAALGKDIQYYSALSRSLDSSLGNMLENMAITIAKLHYEDWEGCHLTAEDIVNSFGYVGFDFGKSMNDDCLQIDRDFWNMVCDTRDGYTIVREELSKAIRESLLDYQLYHK